MKRYKLTNTLEQTVVYECEIEANSLEKAEEKVDEGNLNVNWEEVDSWCNSNNISVKEVEDK